MKKKCCFIIPYFGQLPQYFSVFLKTCEYNEDYNWIIFTDDSNKYILPKNVQIINISFQDLQLKIQKKFDFTISLDSPYKLCDYKPAYGYIFEEYLEEYRYWGHCDLDIILGNINKFITDEMLEFYDKIFLLGHMMLYKNTYDNNRVFMQKYKGKELYKQAFSTSKIAVFDETGINEENVNSLFINMKKNIFTKDLSMNIKVLPTKFVKTTFDFQQDKFVNEEYKKAIYIWKEGNLYRLYIENGKLKREDFLYMHLQSRKMRIKNSKEKSDYIQIIPNYFINMNKEIKISVDNFYKLRKKTLCLHYIELKLKRLKNKWRKR